MPTLEETREKFLASSLAHDKWRLEHLPSPQLMELVRSIQDLAMLALRDHNITLTSVAFDRLPVFNATKPPAELTCETVAGSVKVVRSCECRP